ncbi:acyltransferase [Accumulibacter sp.]|uniref:acyltransferase family protein n=1 Tax=Accumulibacter sp. TaxID=2053492 RepID=UPI00261BFDB9|nr:acyltransferase [Accumulibacter sp.]
MIDQTSNSSRAGAASGSNRLVEIDALRGVAALAVVLFHYTTHYARVFGADPPPSISVSGGHYGVNLFFIISGFVIFMTLDRTAKPMDFVVSRFSRLFPAYWVAIVMTFSLTHLLGLPGKLVDIGAAVGNLIMIHGLFRVPHVDGVYWTLEVELLFYCGMLALFRLRRLDSIHYVLLGLLAARLTYFVLEKAFGIDLSWTIYRLLILRHIPWFALGISIYLATRRREGESRRAPALTAACAIVTLLIAESVFVGMLAVILAGAVFLAATARLSPLRHAVFVWLGAISYPLYLLHENIGWSIQLRLQALGVPIDLTVVLAMATSLTLATALTHWVEQPAMRWIRARYRRRLALA